MLKPLIYILIFAIFSCTRQSKKIYVDGELVNHFYFKKGSYWIYRDSLTGVKDSVSVQRTQESFSGDIKSIEQHQSIFIELTEFNDSNRGGIFIGDILLTSNTLALDHLSTTTFGRVSSIYPYQPTYATIPINGHIFTNVLDMTDSNYRVFINVSVGIIKMKVKYPYDTIKYIWELERFNRVY